MIGKEECKILFKMLLKQVKHCGKGRAIKNNRVV